MLELHSARRQDDALVTPRPLDAFEVDATVRIVGPALDHFAQMQRRVCTRDVILVQQARQDHVGSLNQLLRERAVRRPTLLPRVDLGLVDLGFQDYIGRSGMRSMSGGLYRRGNSCCDLCRSDLFRLLEGHQHASLYDVAGRLVYRTTDVNARHIRINDA